MPVTDLEIRQQIILEVGDVDPTNGDPPTVPDDGIIARRIDYLWERYAGWDRVVPGLRELFCRQAAIRLVLGVLSPRRFEFRDNRAGLMVKAHEMVDSYQHMLAEVTDQIKLVRQLNTSAAGGYHGARLVHTAPVEVGAPPDPNAMRYGGTVRHLEPDHPRSDVPV